MNIRVYLCDLPADCDEEQVIALLQPYGQVIDVELLPPREGAELRRALVGVESNLPKLALIGQLNRKALGDQRIVATPAHPPDGERELSHRQMSVSAEIAAQLGEKFRWPRVMIQQTVGLCGVRFALEMMRRAQAIDAGEGMLVPDGSRRRTVGGIFFALTRRYVTPEVGREIFRRTRQTARAHKATIANARKAESAPALPNEASAPEQKPVTAPQPEPDTAPQPEPDTAPEAESLDAARARLDTLRQEIEVAQSALEAMRRGQVPQATGGFSLMKQMVDAQRAIDALLAEHPELA